MPPLVRELVVAAIVGRARSGVRSKDATWMGALRGVSGTSRDWRESAAFGWHGVLDDLRAEGKTDAAKEACMDRYGLTPCAKASLLTEIGCQRCGAPRITKVHWPFPVRVCAECVRSVTVSSYRLENEYGIKAGHLPFFEVGMWNRMMGGYTLRFHFVPDVRALIGGKTLSEHKHEALERVRGLVLARVREKEPKLGPVTAAEAAAISPTFAALEISNGARADKDAVLVVAEVAKGRATARLAARFFRGSKTEADAACARFPELRAAITKAARARDVAAIDALQEDAVARSVAAAASKKEEDERIAAEMEERRITIAATDAALARRFGGVRNVLVDPHPSDATDLPGFIRAADERRRKLMTAADAMIEASGWTPGANMCPVCGRVKDTFARAQNLEDHVRGVHGYATNRSLAALSTPPQ